MEKVEIDLKVAAQSPMYKLPPDARIGHTFRRPTVERDTKATDNLL